MENPPSEKAPLPQKDSEVPILEVALVITATFLLTIVLGAVVLLTLGTATALIFGELIILLVPLGYLLTKRVNIKSYIGIHPHPRSVAVGLAFGVILLLLNIVVSEALTIIFGVSQAIEESNALLANLSTSTVGFIAVASSLLLAGFCEEFAFRGFLQNALSRKYSFVPALVLSAIVFGLFHFDPQIVYILAAMTSGLVLGYINQRWNYVAAATAHSTMNLIVLLILVMNL
ncbi:MAG: CPBP family intramembrane metalloprotease [Candidatus Bathyarchaeota archaeon]|nr:CPBP family intramembrane metalloprotease [Candidatus Bathyarchaeota archaeon]